MSERDMRKHRGILTALALVGLVAVSVGVGFQVARYLGYVLPDPATADRDGLMRWLVLRDLAEEPDDVRLALVGRLEEILHEPEPLDVSQASDLSHDQCQRLCQNADRLQRDWFYDRVEGCRLCADGERTPFLDRQISTILRWSAVSDRLNETVSRQSGGAKQSGGSAGGLGGMFSQIPAWIAEAPGERRTGIRGVVRAALVRWLATHEVSERSLGTRIALARTLAEELHGEIDVADSMPHWTDAEKQTFFRNADLLVGAWFIDQSREYYQLAERDRLAYLDRQLDRVAAMRGLDQVIGQGQASGEKLTLAEATARWTAAAPIDEQTRVREFAQIVQGRLFWRGVKGLLRIGG